MFLFPVGHLTYFKGWLVRIRKRNFNNEILSAARRAKLYEYSPENSGISKSEGEIFTTHLFTWLKILNAYIFQHSASSECFKYTS